MPDSLRWHPRHLGLEFEVIVADNTPGRMTRSWSSLSTRCLVLDAARMESNIGRLRTRLQRLGVAMRPHLKTVKCREIARHMMDDATGPAAVSTLREAEVFGGWGVKDIVYAVGIEPSKLRRVIAIRESGTDLSVTLDSVEQARAVCDASRHVSPIPVFIEVNCNGYRSGVSPKDSRLLEVAGELHDGGAELRGVLTHAGSSYDCYGRDELIRMAEVERTAAVTAAEAVRAAGFPCPVVSVGSTPTAFHARSLPGVTEVRAGVFPFFDLVMLGLGVCSVDDIAISVLATVIGHRIDEDEIIVDAGWTAMSSDPGAVGRVPDYGFGLVCTDEGSPFADLIVRKMSQEHGVLGIRSGSDSQLPDLPIGTRVRLLPNHACATASQHDEYIVMDGDGNVRARWPHFRGW